MYLVVGRRLDARNSTACGRLRENRRGGFGVIEFEAVCEDCERPASLISVCEQCGAESDFCPAHFEGQKNLCGGCKHFLEKAREQ